MTDTKIIIRGAIPRDVTEIATLESAIFSDPWSEGSLTELLGSDSYTIFSAERDGKVIGYAIFSHVLSEGELLRVAVSPEARRLGIGGRLITAFLEDTSIEKLFLEVRSRNIGAIALYTSLGFNPIGKRRAYYKNPVDDALLMELDRTEYI